MLKVLPMISYNTTTAKCGEIHCQSSKDFMIICTFCKMKMFNFEDFLLHFKNIHFLNELLNTEEIEVECKLYPEEYSVAESVDHESDNSDNEAAPSSVNGNGEEEEEEELRCFAWPKENIKLVDVNDAKIVIKNDKVEDIHLDANQQNLKQKKISAEQKCKQCERTFTSIKNLKMHIKQYHEMNLSKITCTECLAEFNKQTFFEVHVISEHGGLPCPHCAKRFKVKKNLKGHIISHTGVKDFKCDFADCEKAFFTRRNMVEHKRTHKKKKLNSVCEICGYRCSSDSVLQAHTRSHTGEKPFPCSICEKYFGSKSLVTEHMAMHSNERKYVCDVCGASFARPKALYHHKPLHLDIKKFVCKICGCAFAQAAGLSAHRRKHKDNYN